eukprot:jgi/Tetstr1/440126/TSEL_028483.t1
MEDATPDQLRFVDGELAARFLASGAWEEGHCSRWVSRLLLVPKPSVNKWRPIIDMRPLNRYCEERDLSFETLTRLRHLVRPGGYIFSMDLHGGFYAVGVAPEDRDNFTVDYRGKIYRLAGLSINGRSNYKPVKTVYMHVDNSGYGWGAVLGETTDMRGLWHDGHRELHVAYKELTAVWYAVLTFLVELRGRQVLIHEGNMEVVYILANLTSRRSPLNMAELRKLSVIFDTNDKSIRSRYINHRHLAFWPDRSWHQRLSEMVREVGVFPLSPPDNNFAPGRLGVRDGIGPPK